jgi:hypothetical protein
VPSGLSRKIDETVGVSRTMRATRIVLKPGHPGSATGGRVPAATPAAWSGW